MNTPTASCISPRARTFNCTTFISTTRRIFMRRLAAVDITTQEACGNSVRNITACTLGRASVTTKSFDVSPYADAMMRNFCSIMTMCKTSGANSRWLFRVAPGHACGLVKMHDLGLLGANARELTARSKRGIHCIRRRRLRYSSPTGQSAGRTFASRRTVAAAYAQAVSRVFARLGEKKNRNRARIKFLVEQAGHRRLSARGRGRAQNRAA